ncbi:30S ribosomal protein S7 [Candidatus Gottesmanbacteria bacterium]|nr:30S ribosomal protein S7 [Candidatus Gottesmanbacteria bacterium]
MARGGRINKPPLALDPVYNNRLMTRFINRCMERGKKRLAERLVYDALEQIQAAGHDPIKIFESAITNVGPRIEVRPRRIGGASYQVPIEVRGDRRVALAIRWIISSAKKRTNKEYKSFPKKLASELIDASQNLGEAIKKRDMVHRMAEANKAFAHFRW